MWNAHRRLIMRGLQYKVQLLFLGLSLPRLEANLCTNKICVFLYTNYSYVKFVLIFEIIIY